MATTESKVDLKTAPHRGDHSHAGRTNAAARAPRPQRPKPIIRGQDGTQWKDIYHYVLIAPWWQFILGLAAIYFALNAVFAGLFMLDPDGIANGRHGSFADAFFFSVQTLGTIGYGVLAPKTRYANIVVTVESFVSLLNLALATGLIFARFSRPFARVVFSNVAVIVPFEGVPTLMFRAANQRGNQILDANATVSFARQVTTAEGIVMRRFEELKLLRPRTPLFSLSWTMMHQIDAASPLYGADIDTLHDQQTEIIVLLSGMDETLSQTIYARHAYSPDDILFDRRFVDVLTSADTGRMVVNLHRFHDTQAWTPP
jgi:inward rectifier potassium channel